MSVMPLNYVKLYYVFITFFLVLLLLKFDNWKAQWPKLEYGEHGEVYKNCPYIINAYLF